MNNLTQQKTSLLWIHSDVTTSLILVPSGGIRLYKIKTRSLPGAMFSNLSQRFFTLCGFHDIHAHVPYTNRFCCSKLLTVKKGGLLKAYIVLHRTCVITHKPFWWIKLFPILTDWIFIMFVKYINFLRCDFRWKILFYTSNTIIQRWCIDKFKIFSSFIDIEPLARWQHHMPSTCSLSY